MILRRTLSWEDNFNHVCLAHMSDLSMGQTYEHDESWLYNLRHKLVLSNFEGKKH
jgi:hypothetical protein